MVQERLLGLSPVGMSNQYPRVLPGDLVLASFQRHRAAIIGILSRFSS